MREPIAIRTYRPADLEALVTLINEADAVDRLGRSTTVEKQAHEMAYPTYHPETDCFLAWAPGGPELLGVADLYAAPGDSQIEGYVHCWGVVHPAWRRHGVGLRLLQTAYRRGMELTSDMLGQGIRFQCWARDVEVGAKALFESFGLAPVRYSLNLTRPINNGLPPVDLPAGYRLRTFDPERDLEATWRVDDTAFRDHWGHTSHPLTEFAHHTERPEFRPDLCFLAEETARGEVVGIALNRIDPAWIAQTGRQEGQVGTLAVLREHRRRGLGTALLAHSLHALRQAGMDHAHLGADAENLTGAVRLYERAGFRVRHKGIVYRKTLRPREE